MFLNNQKIVAVGPYLSCQHHPHIQSFLIVLDIRGLQLLKKTWRCPNEGEDKTNWIIDTEVVIFIFFWCLNKKSHKRKIYTFKKLGRVIYESCYEMEGLIMAFNGKTNYKSLQPCIMANPTYMYPLSFEYTNILKEELATKNCNYEYLQK